MKIKSSVLYRATIKAIIDVRGIVLSSKIDSCYILLVQKSGHVYPASPVEKLNTEGELGKFTVSDSHTDPLFSVIKGAEFVKVNRTLYV